jgi:hypothetical protein
MWCLNPSKGPLRYFFCIVARFANAKWIPCIRHSEMEKKANIKEAWIAPPPYAPPTLQAHGNFCWTTSRR